MGAFERNSGDAMKTYKFYDKELDIYYDVEVELGYEDLLEVLIEITGDLFLGEVQ